MKKRLLSLALAALCALSLTGCNMIFTDEEADRAVSYTHLRAADESKESVTPLFGQRGMAEQGSFADIIWKLYCRF